MVASRRPSSPAHANIKKLPQAGKVMPGFRPNKTSATSDPVTGISWHELAKQGVTHYMRAEDYNVQRPSNTRKPLPTAINRNVIDDGNPERKSDGFARRLGTYGGGLVYSPAFHEYIAEQIPHVLEETRLTCWRWFESDYVYAAMLKAFPAAQDRVIIKAVLEFRRYGRKMADVAGELGKTIQWLSRQEKRFALYAREHFGMPGKLPPDVQVWHAPIESGPMVTGEMAG